MNTSNTLPKVLWCKEAVSSEFLRYEPAKIASRFFLPYCASLWHYRLDNFYQLEVLREHQREHGAHVFPYEALRPELWHSINDRKPLQLRDDLWIVFLRGDLYPEELARERSLAVRLSEEKPKAAIVLTSFDRTDIYVAGHLVRQYGLRDWEERLDELGEIFDSSKGKTPRVRPAEEEKRLNSMIRSMYGTLAEALNQSAVVRVLKKHRAKEDPNVVAVQVLGYVIFLRILEEKFPYDRNYLRRFHFAYSGDGLEAYGDVALCGTLWSDINRVIRGMSETGDSLSAPIGYKFPDRSLRHKMWSMGGLIPKEKIQQVLQVLVTERLGELRISYLGPVLGNLLARVRGIDTGEDGSSLLLCKPVLERSEGSDKDPLSMDIEELRLFFERKFSEELKPAYEKRDPEAFQKACDDIRSFQVLERHKAGPVLIAQAAKVLLDFVLKVEELADDWKRETAGDLLFSHDDTIQNLGSGLTGVRYDHEGPYWHIFSTGMLRGQYETFEDAEIAELTINALAIMSADESLRYPELLKTFHLKHYLGRFLEAPNLKPTTYRHDDRSSDQEEELPLEEYDQDPDQELSQPVEVRE